MPLFGPPNIPKLKTKKDVKELIKAIGYEKDSNIRKDAILALGDLRITGALNFILDRYVNDKAYEVREAAMTAAKKLKWVPGTDLPSAIYWNRNSEFEKCAACGSNAIQPLLEDVIERNYKAIDAFVTLGQPALDTLFTVTNSYFEQYKTFVTGITQLDYRLESAHQKTAIIEKMVGVLGNCVYTIGKYNTLQAEMYLIELYKEVNQIYTNPALDIIEVAKIRGNIVTALGHAVSYESLQFLAEVLENDSSISVMRNAVDVLERIYISKKLTMTEYRKANVKEALQKALIRDRQHGLVSSRESKITNLLKKIK